MYLNKSLYAKQKFKCLLTELKYCREDLVVHDVCDVTLSVHPHRASLKNMPDHGGNRTYDLWDTSPMLCQLSYAVRSVRVSSSRLLLLLDIIEL